MQIYAMNADKLNTMTKWLLKVNSVHSSIGLVSDALNYHQFWQECFHNAHMILLAFLAGICCETVSNQTDSA